MGLVGSRQGVACAGSSRVFFWRVATAREASQSGAWARPTPHASRGNKAIDFEWGSWTRASVWSAPAAAGAFFGASPPRGKRPKAALGRAALHTLRTSAKQCTLKGGECRSAEEQLSGHQSRTTLDA